jgi:hypothetical protein
VERSQGHVQGGRHDGVHQTDAGKTLISLNSSSR